MCTPCEHAHRLYIVEFRNCEILLCRAAIRPARAEMRNVRRQGMEIDGVFNGGRVTMSITAHLENMLMVARMIGLVVYGVRQSPARVRCDGWELPVAVCEYDECSAIISA